METTLQHDPRTKQQLKDILYNFLYAPIQKKYQKQLDSLIIQNCLLTGASHKSFLYKGVLYASDNSKPPRKMNTLAPQLHPAMNGYLAELKILNTTEVPFVLGFITHVLNSSNDLYDYLRVFPSAVHNPIEELINSCPCRAKHLTDFDVDCIQKKNQASIALMKARMVTNLLI